MSRLRYIPNLVTLANLVSGCVGVVAVAKGELAWGAYMIWLAALFDFLDGLTARTLNAFSSIGGELDSLADMVSFGFLPSFIMYALLEESLPPAWNVLAYLAFLVAVCSAVRLAIFNIDTRQTEKFIGLPTPASALLISALPLSSRNFMIDLLNVPTFLIVIVLLDSWMMVSNVSLMAFKFKNFTWRDNKLKYIFLLISLLAVFVFNTLAIPIVIILYVILSVMQNSRKKSSTPA